MARFHTLAKTLSAIAALTMCAACSIAPASPGNAVTTNLQTETILLVSRENGSIIRQTVSLDADICLKSIQSPMTTCFTQGSPIINDVGTIVGYEMNEHTVELVGAH